MEEETVVEENALFDPVQFVFAGYIGAGKTAEQSTQYQWAHQDIVRPQASHPLINYVLFHTPVIYNWIKEVRPPEASELDRYLKGQSSQSLNRVSSKNLQEELKVLAARWEVVRLCFEAQFFVEKVSCKHLAKRLVRTSHYSYKWKAKTLGLDRLYCQECKSWQHVERAELKIQPEVVMLDRLEKDLSVGGDAYELYLAVVNASQKQVLIKIAGGIWHRVTPKEVRVASAQGIASLKAEKYFYCKVRPEKLLKASTSQKQTTSLQQQVSQLVVARQTQQRSSQHKSLSKARPQPQVPQKIAQSIPPPFEKKVNVYLQPLQEETYQPQTYVHVPQYKQAVLKSYQTEKKKDEYDIEYDRGKLKKVRHKLIKKKIDFNELARKVKQGGHVRHDQPKKQPVKPAWPDRDDLE